MASHVSAWNQAPRQTRYFVVTGVCLSQLTVDDGASLLWCNGGLLKNKICE